MPKKWTYQFTCRSRLHLLHKAHDQNQHGEIAEHQNHVIAPRPLLLALLETLLREEVHRLW